MNLVMVGLKLHLGGVRIGAVSTPKALVRVERRERLDGFESRLHALVGLSNPLSCEDGIEVALTERTVWDLAVNLASMDCEARELVDLGCSAARGFDANDRLHSRTEGDSCKLETLRDQEVWMVGVGMNFILKHAQKLALHLV